MYMGYVYIYNIWDMYIYIIYGICIYIYNIWDMYIYIIYGICIYI